jgi:3,4-dihydroxy 2-butanone 4-phosphate synthase / GTP cyclohydrolase II
VQQVDRAAIATIDPEGENEGDLIMAAEFVTPEALAFMIRHTSGIISVGITDEQAQNSTCPRWSPSQRFPRNRASRARPDSTGVG